MSRLLFHPDPLETVYGAPTAALRRATLPSLDELLDFVRAQKVEGRPREKERRGGGVRLGDEGAYE